MFKNSKKVLSLVLTVALAASMTVPALAYNSVGSDRNDYNTSTPVGQDQVQSQQSEYNEVSGENRNAETTIYATKGSTFTTLIPKTLILNGTAAYKGDYVVSVKGDMADEDSVSIVPRTTEITLTKVSGNYVDQQRPTLPAYVSQAVNVIEGKDVSEDTWQTLLPGSIEAPNLKAGSWKSTLIFDIVFIDGNPGSTTPDPEPDVTEKNLMANYFGEAIAVNEGADVNTLFTKDTVGDNTSVFYGEDFIEIKDVDIALAGPDINEDETGKYVTMNVTFDGKTTTMRVPVASDTDVVAADFAITDSEAVKALILANNTTPATIKPYVQLTHSYRDGTSRILEDNEWDMGIRNATSEDLDWGWSPNGLEGEGETFTSIDGINFVYHYVEDTEGYLKFNNEDYIKAFVDIQINLQ